VVALNMVVVVLLEVFDFFYGTFILYRISYISLSTSDTPNLYYDFLYPFFSLYINTCFNALGIVNPFDSL
jgi:hypothetical protein